MRSEPRRPERWPAALVVGVVLVIVSSGCRPAIPRIEFENRRYSAALRTATNTRSGPRLARVRELIERDREAGMIAPEEHAFYMAIVKLAEGGEWERAEEQTVAFRRAQRPTSWW
jgi:hypothetical protein